MLVLILLGTPKEPLGALGLHYCLNSESFEENHV